MREGRISKRCSTCGAPVVGRSCVVPGHESFVWQAMVDVNPPGAPRKRRSESFATKPEAIAKVNEWQTAAKRGTLVDRSKQTLGGVPRPMAERRRVA